MLQGKRVSISRENTHIYPQHQIRNTVLQIVYFLRGIFPSFIILFRFIQIHSVFSSFSSSAAQSPPNATEASVVSKGAKGSIGSARTEDSFTIRKTVTMPKYSMSLPITEARYPDLSMTINIAATRHSLLVTDIFSSSLDSGFQVPQTNLVTGFMNPDPFPLINPIMTISNSWSGNTLAASLIPPRVFFARKISFITQIG